MKNVNLGLTTTIMVAGISLSLVNGTTTIMSDSVRVPAIAYSNEDITRFVTGNQSYDYRNNNIYYESSSRMIDREARNLFGNMRDATKEELKGIDDYFASISKETGVNFWDLC